ncbi:hypothetical protein [Streptomyces cinnamoneus]|uniref:hypothetical protein n=1 Tax=Streptomyces cinnamoneus TaxID=53446 RepID=UPI003791F5C5
MRDVIVVYELDKSPAASSGPPEGEQAPAVRLVHAAPTAPGSASLGPRTFCGKDTFAMRVAPWKPSEHPGSSWYAPEHADRACGACDTAMEDEA